MTKLLLTLSFFIASCWVKAQTFTDKALAQSVLQLNSSKTTNDYDNLFNKFSTAKTTETWQAKYYAVVSLYLKNETLLNKAPGASLMDDNALARKIATGIWTIQRDNAEVNILLGLLYFQKIQIDGSQNNQLDLNAISQSIAKAETSSSNNPRLAVLQAKIKEKSGDKSNADILYRKALGEFSNQNSSDSKSPSWGKQLVPTVQ
ncbi:hypothetical protein CQ046_01570 [Chryseobacterium sp. MYb7]|uniref:hypothetical protein n=1 Tax=Chryseobacterium sp. MYb7 TaxID=1827290 RepID=UPI000D00BDBD|nr:hypothetical protein [Chryseobacterium sp. MYb7]PRB06809.1 hypothetical protein CQ046_01570 [Chryseobacterium sp. MYb7]